MCFDVVLSTSLTGVYSQRYRDVIEASDAIDELVNISVQAITDFNVSTLPSKGTTNVSSDTHRIQQIIDRKKVLHTSIFCVE